MLKIDNNSVNLKYECIQRQCTTNALNKDNS